MTTRTFFMTGPKDGIPAGYEAEEGVAAVIGEYGVPTFDTISELRASLRPGREDPATRATLKITVELIDEADYVD